MLTAVATSPYADLGSSVQTSLSMNTFYLNILADNLRNVITNITNYTTA